MASYIDWYLIELERRLSGRMPSETVFSLVSEVEDHLRLKKDDLTAAGMNGNEAERVAAESFGDVNEVALEAIEGGVSEQRRAAGRTNAILALAAIWISCIVVAATGFVPEITIALFVVILVATGVFWFGSARAGRPQWRTIVAGGAISTFVMILILPAGFRPVGRVLMSNYWIANDVPAESRYAADVQAELSRLTDGMAFYKQLDAAHGNLSKVTLKAPKYKDGQFIVLNGYEPYQFMHGPSDELYYRGDASTTLAVAKESWIRLGPMMQSQTQSQLSMLTARLTNLVSAQKSHPSLSAIYVLYGALVGSVIVGSMLLVNVSAVGLGRAARRRRIRRPQVA